MFTWRKFTMQCLHVFGVIYILLCLIKPVKAMKNPLQIKIPVANSLHVKNLTHHAVSQRPTTLDQERLAKLYIVISGAMILQDMDPLQVVLFLRQQPIP